MLWEENNSFEIHIAIILEEISVNWWVFCCTLSTPIVRLMFSWTELSLQPQGCESLSLEPLRCVSSQKLTPAHPSPRSAPAVVRTWCNKCHLLAQVMGWRRHNALVVAAGRAWFTLTGTAVAPRRGVSTTSKQETGQLGLSVNYTAQRQLSCLPSLLQAGPWQELPCQRCISTFAQRLHCCQLALPALSYSWKHLMLLRREFGPASCRVFNRYPVGESAKSPGVLLFPGKKLLLNSGCWPLNKPAQLQASLHSQEPVPSPWFSRAGSAADGSLAASASSCRAHSSPAPLWLLLHTSERDVSLGQPPSQPPRLCTEQEQELGNYLVLNGVGLMKFFFMTSAVNLCSALCWSK